MKIEFTKETLPNVIKSLFQLNNYDVIGPIQVHGAEIDLKATPKFDPFGSPVYIEATVEYVDNDKYGKDIGKLAMIAELEPNAQKLIVSSNGFSLPVKERANKTRIYTLTYGELFAKFEKFDPYMRMMDETTPLGHELSNLDKIYEEPFFEDLLGNDVATSYLTTWRDNVTTENKWLVIIGEYGTGKTALTKILQYRWSQSYQADPVKPIPFRIELRDFTRQFDARGLLHHFLDHNNLSHLPIDFVFSLIRSGRIILLLDGYDEMAQYLHVRERRICLEALAELSADGARGILTSRPNYFTDSEELQVFEILYSSIQQGKYYLSRPDQELIRREAEVDQLLSRFLDRFERNLKDLTPTQTEALIKRVLGNDREGRQVVLDILKRIFRGVEDGADVSLSGKPVIISYLLEIVEGLKESHKKETSSGSITEWQIYKMIVDQLMFRDYRRTGYILPEVRRQFLHHLAVFLSRKGSPHIDEESFYKLVKQLFSRELKRIPIESRPQETDRYFADLRSSSTLTRAEISGNSGWRFSHNSLREFLVTEYIVRNLQNELIIDDQIPISDPMKLFVQSMDKNQIEQLVISLSKNWPERVNRRGVGQLLSLIFDAAVRINTSTKNPVRSALKIITGDPIALNEIDIYRIAFSAELKPIDLSNATFANSTIVGSSFIAGKLNGCNFTNCIIEGATFYQANLNNAVFDFSTIIDVDFSEANLNGASFKGISKDDISIIIADDKSETGRKRLLEEEALGYIQFKGGNTDIKSRTIVLKNHPRYFIIDKILEKLTEQSLRQRRGLQQRGAAQQDVSFSRKFIKLLLLNGILHIPKNRKDLVAVTEKGREVLTEIATKGELPEIICDFLQAN